MGSRANAVLYDQWFGVADEDGDGRLTGVDAVTFFARSGLPNDVLANVWSLADSKKRGYLDRTSFHQALDLISVAQQGEPVSRDAYAAALHRGIPAPRLQGMPQLGGPSPQTTNPYAAEPPAREAVNPYASMTPQSSGGSIRGSGGSGTWGSQPSHAAAPAAPPAGNKPVWSKDRKPIPARVCTSVVDGLKQIYFSKVKPLEEQFKFGHFFSPLLHESDFEAKPSILLLGQYSTGKTTFIKYLLGRDFPGCHIGPEPTTDRFMVVHHGSEDRRIPGNTLAVQPDKPYQGLSHFGTGFLSRFEGSQCNAPLLQEITLVDTPGVLSGEKQRIDRNYNFMHVCQWFAARCDLILLLFDPYKLDISDEFRQVIDTLKGHDDKAPISLDKNPNGAELFQREQQDLLHDLQSIPQRSCDRKINEFVKRVRAARIHLLLLGHLRKQMPTMFGKEKAQKKVLDDLAEHFRQVQREHHLPPGDFPDVSRFKEILSGFDLTSFPKVTKGMVKQMEDALSLDIPNLVRQFDNPYGA